MGECFIGGISMKTKVLDGSSFQKASGKIILPPGVTWGDIEQMLLVYSSKPMSTVDTVIIEKDQQYIYRLTFDSSGNVTRTRWQHYDSESGTNIDTVMNDGDTEILVPGLMDVLTFLPSSIVIQK